MKLSTSCRQMEKKSKLEAKKVYNTLMDTGGRPSRQIRPIPDIHDAKHTDKHVHPFATGRVNVDSLRKN